MKIGDLVQSRWKEERALYGIGIVINRCEEGACERQVHEDAHWIIHFPNRKEDGSVAGFIHTGPIAGQEKQFKWMVIS